MGFFGKTKKRELVLVFDIGSSSVGGVFFEAQENGVPKILFSVREPIALEMTVNTEKFLASTIKSLDVVVDKVYNAKIGAPSKIFCVLASPWHVSQTRIIKLEKNAPFIFTSKLAEELTQKEIALFEEEHLKKYSGTSEKVRSIEFKNIKTVLNGYETANPLNQKVRELEMHLFISIGSEQVLSKIEESIKKHFQLKEIKFSSFVIAAFTVVRDIYVNEESFLLIDVGGEVTDISMVKKNALRESSSFPLGVNFMIRGVAEALNIPLAEANSFMSLYKDGHAGEAEVRKIEPTINKLKTEWLHEFQEVLSNLTDDVSLPSIIYITIDKEQSDFFCNTIKIEQFNQYSFTDSKFKISILNAGVFHGMATFEENTIRDEAMIIDSIYFSRLLK